VYVLTNGGVWSVLWISPSSWWHASPGLIFPLSHCFASSSSRGFSTVATKLAPSLRTLWPLWQVHWILTVIEVLSLSPSLGLQPLSTLSISSILCHYQRFDCQNRWRQPKLVSVLRLASLVISISIGSLYSPPDNFRLTNGDGFCATGAWLICAHLKILGWLIF
jgi:hypothetical protein